MSSIQDVERFLSFVDEFYVEKLPGHPDPICNTYDPSQKPRPARFYIERLCIYPIKSCGGFTVPDGKPWEVKPEGLAWDREWCLIHLSTGAALSQKRYPRMALIRPLIDLDRGVLLISRGPPGTDQESLDISISRDDKNLAITELCKNIIKKSSTVCGDKVTVQVYSSPSISAFFSTFLNVPCTLARFSPYTAPRYWKSRRAPGQCENDYTSTSMPGSFPRRLSTHSVHPHTPILLSNESPMLLISRSSVNRVNDTIKAAGKSGLRKTVAIDVFRANIIVTESLLPSISLGMAEQPFIEDTWSGFQIGPYMFDVLGSCERCQMVCIDQLTGERSEEPFSTLAKTRKVNGKVIFGRHVCLSPVTPQGEGDAVDDTGLQDSGTRRRVSVKVGDVVVPFYDEIC
jgi:molybdenum cofactor sulfurtransferase